MRILTPDTRTQQDPQPPPALYRGQYLLCSGQPMAQRGETLRLLKEELWRRRPQGPDRDARARWRQN